MQMCLVLPQRKRTDGCSVQRPGLRTAAPATGGTLAPHTICCPTCPSPFALQYRTLSNHLHAAREGSQRQQQQPAHSEDGATSSGGGVGSSWEIPAARRGGSAAAAGTASEAMAEAGRKAAAIAEKLDRLLTPQSRAAVHGGASGAPKGSRFAAQAPAAAAATGEDGAAQWQGTAGHHSVWGLAALAAGEPGDAEDIPLRQRFGGTTSSCSLGL